MAHLRLWSHCTPRKLSSWDQRGDKTHGPPGVSVLAKHLVTWLVQTWGGHKTQVQPSLCLCGLLENVNLNDLDLGSARNPGPTLDSSPAEQPGAWTVYTGKAHTLWAGANPLGSNTASTPHTRQWYLSAMFLSPHSTAEQVSLNKWPPLPSCVRAETRHWRDLRTEEAKINRGNCFGSDRCNRLKPCR